MGQQVSATSTTFAASTVTARINLMIGRANAGVCDLVVKGVRGGEARGWLYQPGAGQFQSDRASEPLISEAALRGQAATAGQELTYTAVPLGSGRRIGIDRDEDGFLDRTELDAGSDPANAASVPGPGTTTTTVATPTSTTAPPTTTTSSTSTTHELEHGDDYDQELEHDDDASLSRPEVPLIAAPHEGRRGAHIPKTPT